jgi:phosphoesterase RecJ-like protein
MSVTRATSLEVPAEVITTIDRMKSPVIVGHVTPDADCLASMMALARTWPIDDERGARVCLPAGSVAHRLEFLVQWGGVPVVGPEALGGADGFIVVDTARRSRCNVGPETARNWSGGRPVVNIDHHVTNTHYGDVNWVVAEASSSAELVFHAIRSAGRPITELVASLLYAGLHSDTRGFTVAESGGRALAVAADLARAGARTAEIGKRLYRNLRPCELALLRVIYRNTTVVADGRIAYSTADHDEIVASGCAAEDIDEHVEVPRSVGGIALAMLFTEGVPGRVRVNFRAEPGFTVLPLAQKVGGGGHPQASGAMLEGTIPEALDRLLPLAEEFLDGRGQGDTTVAR